MRKKSLVTQFGEFLDQYLEGRAATIPKSQPDATARAGAPSWLPSRGNVVFTLLTIVTLLGLNRAGALSFISASAATPQASTNTIAYQGRIASTGGSPLTGTYSMVFRLYNIPASGAPLWEETWTGANGVKVSDGLFNVMLGSLTPIPTSIVSANPSLWLGITVGTDNEMSPRVQLGSVPFSMQALTVPDLSITADKLSQDLFVLKMLGQTAITPTLSGTNWWCASGSETYPTPFPHKTLMVVAWVNTGDNVYGQPVISPWAWDKNGFTWNSCFYYPGPLAAPILTFNALGY